MLDSFKSGIVIVGTLVAGFGIVGKGVWDSAVNVDINGNPVMPNVKTTAICPECLIEGAYQSTDALNFRCVNCGHRGELTPTP